MYIDHASPVVLQSLKFICHKSRSQHEDVASSINYCSLQVIGCAESNGDVGILIGSCKIAVCSMHEQHKMAKSSPERLARHCATLKLQYLAIATFSSSYYLFSHCAEIFLMVWTCRQFT